MTHTKRTIAAIVASVATLGMLASCGGGTGTADDSKTLTIFNSKMEIQTQFEELAQKYEQEKGVHVEVNYSSDTVAAHMATRYASNSPYVLSMVDAKDIYSLGPDHALDLSSEKWVGDTDQAISVDGKVLGFPVSVEARGLIYNAEAIQKVTGKKFDPTQYKTLDAFKQLIADLKAGGMKDPVGVLKEDWSLGAHYLQQVYEEQQDPTAFIKGLHDGSVDLAKDAKFNELMDTFDVLKDNNYAKSAPTSAEREVTSQKLANGEIAFMFGGNWDWAVLNQYEPTKDMGMMPIPQDTTDGSNEKLVGGGSKFFFIDKSDKVTDEQRKEAKDFLNWLVNDKEGQDFIVNTCSMVSPFKNNTLTPADPLGKSVKEYADKGALIANYNYAPDDHYSKLGADFQKYLANQENRTQFADAIQAYWKTAKMDGIK